MKKIKLSLLFFMIALLLSSCLAGKDEIVATVGKENITSQELLFAMVDTLKDADGEKNKEQSLKYLIDHTLFFLDAQDNGIKVSDNEVKTRMNSLYSRDKLNSLKKDYGITADSIKKVIKKQISHQKYITDILENKEGYVPTEEQLLELFYNNYYKAQHILISTYNMDEEQKTDAKRRAQRIYNRIDEETDFNELTLENSEDAGIICGPGEYVVFKEGDMEEWFYEAVSSLEVGGVSEPYESIYGYHIIKRLPLTNFDIADNETELINEHKIGYLGKLIKDLENKYKITKK